MQKILMLSLDKKIVDPTSRAAVRMREYGQEHEIFIVLPHHAKKSFDLSPTVHVVSSGGKTKIGQYWNVYGEAETLLQKGGFDLITTQDPFFLGLHGVWLKQQFKARLEVQLHGDFYSSEYYRQSGAMNRVRYFLGKYVMKRADHIRVVGERIKHSLLRLGVPADKIEVRPVRLDIESLRQAQPRFRLHEKYPGHEKIFVSVARLDPVKNLSWLVETFAEVLQQKPNYLLVIVGEGPERTRLAQRISWFGRGKNVVLEGETPEAMSYIKTADCVLFPSVSEGYGLVVMEAIAAGCPVIMNDVGVANYELKPNDKVKIIPVSDRNSWIQAMLSV